MLRLLEQLQVRGSAKTAPVEQHDTTTPRQHDTTTPRPPHPLQPPQWEGGSRKTSQLASHAVRLLVPGHGPLPRESRLVHTGQTEMDVKLHLTLAVSTRRGVIGQQVGSDPARRGPDSAHHRLERTYPGARLRGRHQARRTVHTAWCNKARGMCYPVCGMVHIKEPLMLIGKSSLCGGSGFPFSLSEWSFTVCLTPYNRK